MRRLTFSSDFYPLAFLIGGFLIVSYTICLAADAIFSGLQMYRAWEPWLPGVVGLSYGSWLLGVVELVLFAIYASALLVVLTRAVLGATEQPASLAAEGRAR